VPGDRQPGKCFSVRGFDRATSSLSLAIDGHSIMQLGNGFAPCTFAEKGENRVQRAANCAAEHAEAEPHRGQEMLPVGLAHACRVFVELAANRHLPSSMPGNIIGRKTGNIVAFCKQFGPYYETFVAKY
jgi:hypothetical protein